MRDTTSLWLDISGGRVQSEDDCLALIDRHFPGSSAHVPHGRGHDCAELAALPSALAVSTDMFWQDSHFRTRYFTPAEAGAKALAVAVSDLAAAGAVPLGFSLGLLLPAGFPAQTLENMLAGMATAAAEYGIFLSGGDIARGDKVGFSLCVWGKSCFAQGLFPRRGQALPGDCVFIAGEAGLARVGLWALERQGREAVKRWPNACAAHLAPKPLLATGQQIARAAFGRDPAARLSLMDLSDGLARDLPRLLGKCGAALDIPPEAVSGEIAATAPLMGLAPEDIYLLGGEDYALIGACPPEIWEGIQEAVPGICLLGKATGTPLICFQGNRPLPQGFDHFLGGKAEQTEHGEMHDAVNQLIGLGREAYRAGLMAGFNGNISCRVKSEGKDCCLITRSGAAKARLREGDFSLLGLPGGEEVSAMPSARSGAPSSESPLHVAVYAACPESRVILHCHPPKLLALSLLLHPEERLKLPLPEAERYRASLACTPFHAPGSPELAAAVAEAARSSQAVWMERHGLVVHGKDPTEVLALSEELEQLAAVQLAVLQPGGPRAD